MDTNKKISFGFSKSTKKSQVVRSQPAEEKKVELIECLEGQSIKIKDAVEVVHEPLVIPIRDNKNNLLDRVKEAKIKRELTKSEVKEEDNRPDSELTIEEQAARELINEARNRLENNTTTNSKVSVLPIKEDKMIIEGEEEPTLDDYENIPISDYGMAMLRGMGWKEGMPIGKNITKAAVTSIPELRPKGLGLGATKPVKAEEIARDKDGKTLVVKRGAYAKIIAGLHKGNYCEVQGLDDEAGRVIVKTSLKGEILTLNEFLVVPVSKEEYLEKGKILNNAKYEKYKKISDKKLESQRIIKSGCSKDKSESDSEEDSNARNKYKKQGFSRSHQVVEQLSEPSDDDSNLNSESDGETRYKKSSFSEKKGKSKVKYEKRGKYKDRHTPSSDSENKYERSRSRYKDSSDSESGGRKKRIKDKKKKKERHRDRSRSHKEKHKNKSERGSRHRSPSHDYKEYGKSKKEISKSRHRRRSNSSNSSSSDNNYRKHRR